MINTNLNKKNSLLQYYQFTKAEQKKYPVISRILKKLTSERIKKEIEIIQKVKLPPELQKWVKEYQKVGERSDFIWKWLYSTLHIVTFSISSIKYQSSLLRTKFFIFAIFAILLNDVADRLRKKNLLNKLLKIFVKPNLIIIDSNNWDQKEKQYFLFTEKLWKDTLSLIKKYPRYKEFQDIFNFDLLQVIIANQYDYFVVNNYYLINKIESWLYPPHTMLVMLCFDLDIMCSSKFNIQELGTLREIAWYVQKMARIGNWINSWEREIQDNDFTSGVFAYAMEENIIRNGDLPGNNKEKIIKKIKRGNIEAKLLKEWESSYIEIYKLTTRMRSVNIKEIPQKLEKLLILELSTKKFK